MPKMFIGTDDLPFALTSPVTTGGTSTAYTLTDSRIGTPADGQVFAFILHTGCGVAPTLAVNGGSAVALMRNTATGGNTGFVSPQLLSGQVVIVRYESSGPAYRVISHFGLQASDIPSTLNATTFGGAVTLSGSISSAGSSVRNIHGNGNANDYAVNVPSGGRHRMTVNGSEFFILDGATLHYAGSAGYTLQGSAPGLFHTNSNNSVTVWGGTSDTNSAWTRHYGVLSTYGGSHVCGSPLITRAASTAIALCPVATGDMAYVTILESSIASCKVKVDTSGTVTFTDLDGNAASASIVNSSSPAAAEYGVYISAGVLYFKGGSSYAGKMASFPQIGKT